MIDQSAKDSAIRRHIARSTVANYLGQIVTFGMGFLLTPFILMRLGAVHYGLWLLVGSVVAYGRLFDFGITGAVTKYVAEYRARGQHAEAQALITTALCIYLCLGLIVIVLAIAVAPVFPTLFSVPPAERATARWLVLLMGLAVGISIPCGTAYAVLLGLQQFGLLNLVGVTGTLLMGASTVIVLLLGGGLLGMVAVNIPITLLMQGLAIWSIKRSAPDVHITVRGARRNLMRTVVSFSSSVFVIQLAGQLQFKTDEIVIGAFLPVRAITPFGIAGRLSEATQLLTGQFLKVLMPLASALHAEDDRIRLRSLFITSTRLSLVSFLPIAGVVIILAQPLLSLWVGPAYADYAALVLILTTARLLDTVMWPAGSVLQGMARHGLLAVMSICSGLANLVLSIALVGSLGLNGVALGTLIPTAVECIVFILPYAARILGVSFREMLTTAIMPALLPALPMGIVLYTLRVTWEPASLLSIGLIAATGVLVYAGGYLAVGASQVERGIYREQLMSSLQSIARRLKLTN